jgi:hypothetical protein
VRLATVLNLELFRARSVRFPSWSLNTRHVEETQLIKVTDWFSVLRLRARSYSCSQTPLPLNYFSLRFMHKKPPAPTSSSLGESVATRSNCARQALRKGTSLFTFTFTVIHYHPIEEATQSAWTCNCGHIRRQTLKPRPYPLQSLTQSNAPVP